MRGGLYADHVDRHGVNAALWTYNQGAPVGAHLLLHLATGDETALAQARATAAASLRRFGPDRTWRHPPVFNAVWFRNLLALDAARSVSTASAAALDVYLTRAWREGRDEDGLFTVGLHRQLRRDPRDRRGRAPAALRAESVAPGSAHAGVLTPSRNRSTSHGSRSCIGLVDDSNVASGWNCTRRCGPSE